MIKLIIINALVNIIFSQKKYEHYNYDKIMTIFEQFSETCSQYIKIDKSQTRYNLDSVKGCGNKECINLIVFLTDFDSYTLDRPSYYISGVVHGDEVIGPTAVTEFVKYFCDTYEEKKNSVYHNILKEKLIIITPMTNAYGYYNVRREEKVSIRDSNKYKNVDPNRDFPYYKSNDNIKTCMETITARTINEIFNEFIIGGGITFHGGTSVIGYAWGNYIHLADKYKGTESPDYNAFNKIGKIMVKLSSSKDNLGNNIRDYELGDMSSTVYPLDGALEDWAYGGWENKIYENMGNSLRPIKTCKSESYSKYEMIWNNDNINKNKNMNDINFDYKLRCLIYLVETSDKKRPDEVQYGINHFPKGIFNFYETINFYGHIPRNMRLMYSAIDLISASIYLDINNIEQNKTEKNNKMIIPFLFMGCLSLEKYLIHKIDFEQITKNMLDKNYLDSNSKNSTVILEENKGINCYYNNLTYYNLVIETKNNDSFLRKLEKKYNNEDPLHYFVRPGGNYDYLGNVLGFKNNRYKDKFIQGKGSIYFIRGEGPDQIWGSQENPDPKVGPQSHPVRSKINSTYFVQNGNYSLKSNYYFYSYPVVAFDNGNIQIIDDVDSFFYEEDFDLLKLIINSNDNNYRITSRIYCHKQNKENDTNFLSSENIFNINLEINLFEEKGNYLKNSLEDKKEIKLLSQMLLNDENEIYHLKNLECQVSSDIPLYINCPNLFQKINGKFIRQKLANSLITFELKIENKSFLNIFGQISLSNDNKGKYFVNYYSKNNNNNYNENNKMLCTSNFPYFLNSNNQDNYLDEIYYSMDITRVSNSKFLLNIDIRQNKNSKFIYFLLFFPFYDKIEIIKIKDKRKIEINLDDKANGKIIGKIVHLIAIENEDYKYSLNLTFEKNDIYSLISSLNKISKKKNYKLIPCSIMSYNSFKNEKSIFEFRKMLEKFSDMKPFFKNGRNIKEIFIFRHLILSCIILSLLITVIFYVLIKKCRKNRIIYNQFDSVEISDVSKSSSSSKN